MQGIYTEDDLAGRITVDRGLFAGTSVDQYDFAVFITEGRRGQRGRRRGGHRRPWPSSYPNGKLQSRTDYIDSQASGIHRFVNIIYLLLALSVHHRRRRHRHHARC